MNDLEACDICYDDCRNVVALDCCNKSKKVCKDCLSCLRSLTCPYCRQPLPDNVTCNMNVSRSHPEQESMNFYNFVQSEMLVDPFAPEYRDSRILRRQVRRIRRRFECFEINKFAYLLVFSEKSCGLCVAFVCC